MPPRRLIHSLWSFILNMAQTVHRPSRRCIYFALVLLQLISVFFYFSKSKVDKSCECSHETVSEKPEPVGIVSRESVTLDRTQGLQPQAVEVTVSAHTTERGRDDSPHRSTNISLDVEIPEIKESTSNLKILYEATTYYDRLLGFAFCPQYSNCRIVDGSPQPSQNFTVSPGNPDIKEASLVMFTSSFLINPEQLPTLPWQVRSKQLWLLKSRESPAGDYRFPAWYNSLFNLTMTYRMDSDVSEPYFVSVKKLENTMTGPQNKVNYKQDKTKGGLALISNCVSDNYDRLKVAEKLGEYIDVDIFGECGKPDPCGRLELECETTIYKQYHFFFAFENSLCNDYITEKLWKRMASPAHFLPVVIGDTKIDLYKKLAPLNSFIHLYNFSSVEALGEYLKKVIENEKLYNSYHQWRESYVLEDDNAERKAKENVACELCRLANEMPAKNALVDVSDWFNSGCKSLESILDTKSGTGIA